MTRIRNELSTTVLTGSGTFVVLACESRDKFSSESATSVIVEVKDKNKIKNLKIKLYKSSDKSKACHLKKQQNHSFKLSISYKPPNKVISIYQRSKDKTHKLPKPSNPNL